jgi:hypothetical protein
MAKKAHSKKTCAAQGWTACKGKGRPIPVGTLVAVRRFNGDTDTFMAGNQGVLDATGRKIASIGGCYSAWDHHDGGPMSVKVKAYRVLTKAKAVERNTAMFREWLNVRENENA